MSGGPFDPLTFFKAIETFSDSGEQAASDKNPRLATVDPNYDGVGNPRLQFDGEPGLTIKTYPYLGTPPPAGSRVILTSVGMGWVINGPLTQPAPAPVVFPPAGRGVVARARRNSTKDFTTDGPHKVTEISAPVFGNRLYRLRADNVGFFSSEATSCRAILSTRSDGTAPTPTSTVRQWAQVDPLPGGRVVSCSTAVYFSPSEDGTLRLLLSAFMTVGTGNWGVFGSAEWPTELSIEDVGPELPLSGTQF